jgi:hypothetical protein
VRAAPALGEPPEAALPDLIHGDFGRAADRAGVLRRIGRGAARCIARGSSHRVVLRPKEGEEGVSRAPAGSDSGERPRRLGGGRGESILSQLGSARGSLPRRRFGAAPGSTTEDHDEVTGSVTACGDSLPATPNSLRAP